MGPSRARADQPEIGPSSNDDRAPGRTTLVAAPPPHDDRAMTSQPADTRNLSIVDLASLLYLGAVWGAAFLFLRIAAPEVGPVWAAEIRLAIGAAILAVVAGPRTWRAARGRFGAFAIVGALFSAIPFSLISIAALTLPAGFTALLNAATPLFTAGIAVAFMGQSLGWRMVAGLALGVVAVIVLVGWAPFEPAPQTLLAVAAGLGAPFSYALAGNFARARLASVDQLELATGMVVGGALVLLPVAALTGAPGSLRVDGIVSLIAVGTLSTALAWPVFFRVLRRTTPTAASTVTFIVPAFALAWGAIALGETVGLGLLVGFALILASLALVLGIVPAGPRPVIRRALLAIRATLA
jgi:drug/metabolite transporter (DMT)-like permease